jgi:hypothetical protein
MLLAMSCAGVKVSFDYNPEIDFKVYKTFDWIPGSEELSKSTDVRNLASNPFVLKRLVAAVENELAKKGYQKQTDSEPELLLSFQTDFEKKKDVYVYSTPGYVHWKRGRRVVVGPKKYVEVDRYQEGTLVLDIIDSASDQLIWQGWATSILRDPQIAEEQLQTAVGKLLENFPPPSED